MKLHVILLSSIAVEYFRCRTAKSVILRLSHALSVSDLVCLQACGDDGEIFEEDYLYAVVTEIRHHSLDLISAATPSTQYVYLNVLESLADVVIE